MGYVDSSGHNGICPEKEAAIKKLIEGGYTKEEAENYYKCLQDRGGSDLFYKIKDNDIDLRGKILVIERL